MRIVVKVGGARLEQAATRAELACSVRAAIHAGHSVVLVHGGSGQMRDWSKRLGIDDSYHDGLRITDADTAEVALAVLGGLVNRQLVQALEEAGVHAVGLTGADGSTFQARVHAPDGQDLGFVGAVHETRSALLDTLLKARTVPVIAPVAPLSTHAPGDRSQFYNINADMAAGPLARALGAHALLFLTDVPGVRDGAGATVSRLSPADCDGMREGGVLKSGMLPKVASALAALDARPKMLVKIAPASGDNAVLEALEVRTGTTFATDARELSHG